MADIEKDCHAFHMMTDMLPPGKDEASVAVSQTHYDRCEVRRLMWELFSKCKDRIDAMTARAEAAEAIVDKLPKTKDGVAVMPGVVVYYTYGELVAKPMCVDDFQRWDSFDGQLEPRAHGEYKGQYMLFYVHDCYSTRAAAEAAQEGSP